MTRAPDGTPLEGPLHVEPARSFDAGETLACLPRIAAASAFLTGSLAGFVLLDRLGWPGERFDAIGRFVCRRITDLLGIRVEQTGLELLDRRASYVFCINHVSWLDLFVVFQSIPQFHRSFQHAAHFKVPVYGQIIRVFGQLPVDRRDRALTQRSFERAVQMLRSGDSFVVFPEGHRTRDGRLGRFYPGAFRLAQAAGVPVVPMAMCGLRLVNPADDWRVRPGTVEVRFGAPLAPEGEVEHLARRAHRALDRLLARPRLPLAR